MSVITKDLGVATAYGYAKSKGYTGTEEEFAELMASYADVAQQAEAAAQDAEDAKDEAVTAKTDAQTAKTAAQAAQSAAETASGAASTKASEAAQSAQAASGSATAAQTSATAASGSAQTAQAAAQTATTKASEASSSASAASTAKTGAETARTGAQTAQANAEAAASSVSASAAQIEQNTEDITGLKNDLSQVIENKNIGNVGYFELTSTQIYASTSREQLAIWFPVMQGMQYTVDKTVRTNYFRIGYTTTVPANGVAITDYQVLDTGFAYFSFVAVKTGYAIVKIYDTRTDGETNYNKVYSSSVAYEGGYDSTVTQEAKELKNLNGLTFFCGATRSLKTLKAGIEAATAYMDSTLYVDEGVYDLMDEFGSAWFEALTASSTMSGLQLKNRIHVIFAPNSKVVSHYSGTNQYAQSLYSPFNAGEYGFTLENLNLECSRCRYGIHDERNGNRETFKSRYVNCKVFVDNSDNSFWTSRCGIGGGLGANAEVEIENCVWKSDNPETSFARGAVYYHLSNNTNNANHRAVVTIKDCYFITGCVELENGRTESISDNSVFVVTNNSFPKVYAGADAQGIFHLNLSSAKNDIYAWGNNIRSA